MSTPFDLSYNMVILPLSISRAALDPFLRSADDVPSKASSKYQVPEENLTAEGEYEVFVVFSKVSDKVAMIGRILEVSMVLFTSCGVSSFLSLEHELEKDKLIKAVISNNSALFFIM